MAVAAVMPSGLTKTAGAPRPAQAGEQPRSVLDNLVLTNKTMLSRIKEDAFGAIRNPLGAIRNMLEGLTFPLLHPVKAFKSWVQAIREDPLDGIASTAGTVTGLGWFLSIVVAVAAIVAAPFTAGASLAIAATAFSVGNVLFAGVIAADAGGILLHEYRGATAKSSGEAIAEGEALASYVEDEALNVIAWAGVNALEARLPRLSAVKVAQAGGRAVGEGLSVVGIYDVPAAQISRGIKKVLQPALANPGSKVGR